jgi:cyclic di-GMP phosphodiesterase
MNPDENEELPFAYGDFTQHAKMKILVVDDQSINVELLQDLLNVAGYKNVRALTDSRLVLETCESFDPDIILLDLMMPHVSGLEILQSLRSTGGGEPFLPVVVLSAARGRNRLPAQTLR